MKTIDSTDSFVFLQCEEALDLLREYVAFQSEPWSLHLWSGVALFSCRDRDKSEVDQ